MRRPVCGIVLLFGLTLAAQEAATHPVTFEDGLAFSAIFQPRSTLIEGGYTLSRHIAVGSTYARIQTEDGGIHAGFAHLNALVFRHNGSGSQGNLYLSAGAGGGLYDDEVAELGYASLQLDYETMRFYTALMSRAVSDGSALKYRATYRIGFAPYVAPYNSLQSWLVAQTMYMPEMNDDLNFMLLLRFFYKTVLWELGGDLNGLPWIQMMVHY
ncbi:MAG: hypothetical protein CMH52_10610 [Myxococcales bacterium]|nr:hypothetical protein [Myxococcales bacterium]